MIDPTDFDPFPEEFEREDEEEDFDEEDEEEDFDEEPDDDFDEYECDLSAARDDDFRQDMNDRST